MRNVNGIRNPFRDGLPKLVLRLLHATLALVLLLAGSLAIAPPSPVQADTQVTLQPGPGSNDGTDDGSATKGKDAHAYGYGLSTNYGGQQWMDIATSSCNPYISRPFIQFSLADMPKTDVVSAKVDVYVQVMKFPTCGWPYSADPIFSLRRVTSPWNEMTLTYNNQPAFAPQIIDSKTISGVAGKTGWNLFSGWVSYDITALYKGWADGSLPNYGIRFSQDNPLCFNCMCAFIFSSDTLDPRDPNWPAGANWPGAQARPKLVVTYAPTTKADTTTSLISSLNSSTYDQPVTFTATVSAATGTPTGTVQFKLDGTDFGTVALSGGSATSGAASTLTVGNHTVVATYSGDTSFNGSTSPDFTQTVNKATATVSLSNLSQTYDGTPKSATATTIPLGLTVTLTYDGLATAPTNAGSYAVVATVQDSNYQGSASGTMVIAMADQTITFGALSDKAYGDADFTVSATASSGLEVGFTASGACTISGDTVHITGVGSCTITAHQSGDSNYNAAPDVSQTFTVNITYDRLSDLVRKFVTKQGIVNSLLAKLDNAQKAEAKGNSNAKSGMIGAFINEVEAQTGKAISAEHAAILISLARAL